MQERQRRSFTEEYKRQAAARGLEWPVDHVGRQGTGSARLGIAALGG